MTPLTLCPRYETIKKAEIHPKTREILRDFPPEVRLELGKAIFDLELGLKLGHPLSKPIPSVGAGVEELRVKDRYGAYRVFYYTRQTDAILVFHAFIKKTQKTPLSEIRIGRKRLKEMLYEKI